MVVARGRLMGSLPPGGAMVAIGASEEEVEHAVAEYGHLSIAALHGPEALVISGAEAAA